MKSFFRNLSTLFPFFANRPSALERAVRPSPKSRRLRMEPLENRALLAVDAFGGAAFADVGESWGPDPAPAFSASELSTDAAETTISLAALNSVPYGPYVTSEQAALIALRSNATLADETLADFGALWDETDETTLAETATDGETLNAVAEALTFEPLDLGEIEQEPGDASVMSGQTGQSGGCFIGDVKTNSNFASSSGGGDSGGIVWNVAIPEDGGEVEILVSGSTGTVSTSLDHNSGVNLINHNPTASVSGQVALRFSAVKNNTCEGSKNETITVIADGLRIGTVCVTIVDTPEFISDVDRKNGTQTEITTDETVRWFDTSGFFDTGITPIIQEQIQYDDSFQLTYSSERLSLELPEGDNSPLRFGVNTGDIAYWNDVQESDRCGKVKIKFTAAYTADSSIKDELTLTLQWADVNKAKEVLETLVENSVQTSQILQRSCAQISGRLKVEIEEAQSKILNIKYAVKEISLSPPTESSGNSPASCGCNPHQAVRVKFRDGSIVDYDRTGAHPHSTN